jgi:acetylornithine deacetylase/succinyl-diaminopimelate desuccinylase-like protein
MDLIQRFSEWFEENLPQIKESYIQFLKIPSISADPARSLDVLACSDFLVSFLSKGGLKAEAIPTDGFPIVYAEEMQAGPNFPTILIYGHYDVQPVDPLELWISPPFEGTESDDKGQIFYACLSVIAWKAIFGALPVNIKFCIEGEEESSSIGLSRALPSLKQKFAADVVLIVDFDSMPDGALAVTLGARGCMGMEVTLTGSLQDLHSGHLGGIAYNPNRALVEILAKLVDSSGKVTVPGFYEGVQKPTQEEFDLFTFPMTEESVRVDFEIEALGNEKGCSLKEANWFRPTMEINGIFGGYAGPGMKTVIPSKATAKLTCRLVPGQNCETIAEAIEYFIRKNVPQGMKVDFTYQGGLGAYRSSITTPLVRALKQAAQEVTGKPSVYALAGGSIPVGLLFRDVLGVEVIGMGYGLSTDAIHSPNEHFDMQRFKCGFLTVAKMIEAL